MSSESRLHLRGVLPSCIPPLVALRPRVVAVPGAEACSQFDLNEARYRKAGWLERSWVFSVSGCGKPESEYRIRILIAIAIAMAIAIAIAIVIVIVVIYRSPVVFSPGGPGGPPFRLAG